MPASITKLFPAQISFAAIMLVVLMANLIIGGILLPTQNAQALFGVGDIVFDPAAVGQFIIKNAKDAAKWSWEKIQWAYSNAQEYIQSAKDIWDKNNYYVKEALKAAWHKLRKMLLNMLVNDIVSWVQGDLNSKPRFVTDWQGFLESAADKAAGQFLTQELGGGFLCRQFSAKLEIALARVPRFDETAACTLSEAVENVEDFVADFSNGGWKAWLAVSEPQNNILGANLLALDRKWDLVAKAQEAAKNEAIAGGGFLGDKVCLKRDKSSGQGENQNYELQNYAGATGGWSEQEISAGGWQCLQWETRTSGRVAGDALSKAVTLDMDWLISAKEFSEYGTAIVDAVINRTIREGVLYMTSSGEGTSAGQTGAGISSPASVSVNLSAIDDADLNGSIIHTVIQQENLLEENLLAELGEQQTNLALLEQITASQQNAVNILQNTANNNYPLPAGAWLGPVNTTVQGDCSAVIDCPCETTTVKDQEFTINGIGSGTLRQIITNTYEEQESWYGSPCTSLTKFSTQSSITNSSLASGEKVLSLQEEIAALQARIDKIDTIINDAITYQDAILNYSDAYDASLREEGNPAKLDELEQTMWLAKDKAIASISSITEIQSNNLNDHLDTVMNLSFAAAQKITDAQTKRGFSADCSFAETGTYQADLCAAQSQTNAIQSNFDAYADEINNTDD